jgi:arabinan endo-1,5-alpha-L-arabinosidase
MQQNLSKRLIRAKHLLFVALVLLMVSCSEVELSCALSPNIADASTATSPIHDPTLIKADDRYYVFSSSDLGSFYQSHNLQQWQFGGEVFTTLPDWLLQLIPEANHIGAPDISFYNGRYVYFFQSHIGNTCNAATGLATNQSLDPNNPNYEWVDHGLILRSEPHYPDINIYCGNDNATFNAIDAHFFVDAENQPWLVFGSTIGGIKLIALNPTTLKPRSPETFTTLAQRFLLQDDPIIEAPHLVFRDGYYYLFVSFNHCCLGADTKYQVRVGRSKKITGPYMDASNWPMYLGGGTVLISRDGDYMATGHSDLYSEDGQDWLVHHAKRADQDYRSYLHIRSLNWTEDGWPSLCKQPT